MAPSLESIEIEVPDDLADAFERHSQETGRTVSELVTESMQYYLAAHATDHIQSEGNVEPPAESG